MSAQHDFTALCRRLIAALSLAVAASLAAWSPEVGNRSTPEAGALEPALISDFEGLVEEEERQLPDGVAGGAPLKARAWTAFALVATPPAGSARPPEAAPGVHRSHPARSGLTRAPPLA